MAYRRGRVGGIKRRFGGDFTSTADNREKITIRVRPDTARRIEQWYEADNCRSKNEFIEKAVNYYANSLAVKDNDRLPGLVAAAIDSRLKTLEDRVSSLLF